MSATPAPAASPFKVQPPAGWRVASIELADAEGQAKLSIERARVEADSVEGIAAGEAERRAAAQPGYVLAGIETFDTAGGPVLAQRYSWQETGGTRREEVALARMVDDSPLAAVLSGPKRAGVELVRAAAEALGALLPGVDSSEHSFGVEELAVLAELGGEKSFPGTGEFALRTEEQRGAAQRSLLARGTLLGVDGRGAHVEPTAAAILAASLHPDSVVDVQHVSATRAERLLVYVGSKTSVTHRGNPHGVHHLAVISTPMLGVAVAAFTGLGGDGEARGETIVAPKNEFGRLREAAAEGRLGELHDGGSLGELMAEVTSSTQVHVARAKGLAVEDTELLWLQSAAGELWMIEPARDSVVVTPVRLQELSRRFQEIWTHFAQGG